VKQLFQRLRGVLIAVAALALSAGLAFGAQPDAGWGLTNASDHAGKTVPVGAGQQATDEDSLDDPVDELEDEDTDEEVEDDTDQELAAGENCSTDPTTLDPEALAELRHGSIVCWAAHQESWPEWFTKRGEFVRCWAHQGKANAPSCTEDPNAAPVADEDAAATSMGHGRPGQGQGPQQVASAPRPQQAPRSA
jgi:hypothetical protein